MNSQNELDEMMMAGEGVRLQGSSPPRTQRLISQFMHIQSANSPENFTYELDDHAESDQDLIRGDRRRGQRARPNLQRVRDRVEEDVENTNEELGRGATTSQVRGDNEYLEEDDPLVLHEEDEDEDGEDDEMMSSDADRRSYRENEEDKRQ